MNFDIFKKIYEIMELYENLLIKKKTYNTNSSEDFNNNNFKDIVKNDAFFNFIFENISIHKILPKNKISTNDNEKIHIQEEFSKEEFPKEEFPREEFPKEEIDIYELKNIYIKKIYKILILKNHPDKNGNKNIFIKCQEYYENKFLIGLLYISYKYNIKPPPLDEYIINVILCEIRIIENKIISMN